jgi:esterase
VGGPVNLRFRDFGGSGPPIVMLHGLFGSSQNWAGVGRELARFGRSVALDLRNHGDSPHDPSHGLSDCVSDLETWCRRNAAEPITLIGHSMGGLAAMGFAIARPGLVMRLVVVDIAPRVYPVDHESEFAALQTDVSGCRTRTELDRLVGPILADDRLRAFILTNAVRDGSGFRWRLNVEALRGARIFSDFSSVIGRYEGDTLFIMGGKSNKIHQEDLPRITRLFPRSHVSVIPEADHWVHVSSRGSFMKILSDFLRRT